jgi:hypothetical protein
MSPQPTTLTPDALEYYERLRHGGTGLGWGIFVRRGFLAWSLAWDSPPQDPPTHPSPSLVPVIPEHTNQPLIHVMAGMVMNARRETCNDF